MKTLHIHIVISVAFVTLLLSCGIPTSIPTLPSKVKVKAHPTINLPVGSDYFDKYLDENVFSAIKDALEEGDDSPDVYDYYNDEDTEHIQTFLLSQTITDLDLDLKKNISANEDAETIDKSFFMESPGKTDITGTVALPLDSIFSAIVGPPTDNFPLGSLTGTADSGSLEFTLGNGFETAIFQSGYITLKFSSAITVSSIGLYGSQGSTNALRLGTPSGTPSNSSIIFLQGSNSLPKKVWVKISYIASSASAVTVTVSKGDVALSAATGVNLPTSIPININIPSISLDIDSKEFLQGTIDVGQFDINLIWPAGWQNFKLADDTKFILTQYPKIAPTGTYPGLNFADKSGGTLKGQFLNLNNIALIGNLLISATNGSFSNVRDSMLDQSYTAKMDISKFSEVLIDCSTGDMNLTQTIIEDLGDMSSMVEEITFSAGGADKGVGLCLDVTEVADGLKMAVSSGALKINDTAASPVYEPLNMGPNFFTNHDGLTLRPRDASSDDNGKLDFTFNFLPKGYIPSVGVLTLNNVIPGEPYTVVKGTVELVFDWISAEIDPGNEGRFEGKQEMNLDFGGGENSMIDDLAFVGTIAQLFIVGPEDFKPDLYLNITYGVAEHKEPFGPMPGKQAQAIPSFVLNVAKEERHHGSEVVHNLPGGGELIEDFNEIMNSRSQLTLEYIIKIGHLHIEPPAASGTQEGQESQKISVKMVILLPMQFTVRNPDVAGLVFDQLGESDLFQRDPGDDSLFDTLKSLQFGLGFRSGENLFNSGKIYLVEEKHINDPDEDILGLLFDFSLKRNVGIYVGGDKIDLIKESNPYIPRIIIVPSKDDEGNVLPLAFLRNGRLGSINFSAEIETEQEISSIL
ncbi:hypothetical protein [Treponema primitia]|uniref:hypothetical protein n=1 Tax=Treponema primitia TaxID=88058 RepID=UPI0002555573|nr:hypothetical protein [Treponema primitia]